MMANTNDSNKQSAAIPGTNGVFDYVVEVELNDSNDKIAAIPGTSGVFDHVVEVTLDDSNDKNSAIPGSTGVFDYVAEVTTADSNESNAAIPGSTGVFDHVAEVTLESGNAVNAAIPGSTGVFDQVVEVDCKDSSEQNAAIPGSTGVFDQVVEVDCEDNNRQNAAIPGSTGIFNHVAEVATAENNEVNAAIPGSTGVFDQVVEVGPKNSNEQNAAIPGSTGVFDRVAEVHVEDSNTKNAAIPGSTGVFNQVVELGRDGYNKNGAIPGSTGVFDRVAEALESNDQNAAIPGTTGVLDQVIEAPQHVARDGINVGSLRLKGGPPSGCLTNEQRGEYEEKGYLVIHDAFSEQDASNMLTSAQALMQRISDGGKGIIRHNIPENAERISPVGRIIATFEPGDKAADPFARRIARLGCAVHTLPAFAATTRSELTRSILSSLGYTDPRITQGQLIAKLAHVGGEVVPHQDGSVSFTDPASAITFWYALEDTTIENGCLMVVPGSHNTTPLRQRLVRGEKGLPRFVNLDTPVWRKGTMQGVKEVHVEEYKALEVKRGTLIVFDGCLVHKSAANESEKDRVAYTFNVVEGGSASPDGNYIKPVDGQWEKL